MRPAHLPALILVAGLAVTACSNSDAPTSIEIDIADIQIRSGACAVPVGSTCNLFAEARTADGVLIQNPILRWTSNNAVASVVGESSTAVVTLNSNGTATITVTDTTGDVSDSMTVRGLIPTK